MDKQHRRWWMLFLLVVLMLGGCDAVHHGEGLERVRKQGVLRVAVDPSFPPFESIDGSNQIVGLDIDLATLLAEQLGVEVQFVPTTYDGLYDALTTGRADVIISALYPDPERTQDFAFSSPYFNAGYVLVVPPDSPIRNLDEVGGHTIAVVLNTAGHMEALRWLSISEPPPQLITVETDEAALAMVLNGESDGAVVSNLAALTAEMRGAPLRTVEPFVEDEIYVIAARREDADLIAVLSEQLQALAENGTMDRLMQRWFTASP